MSTPARRPRIVLIHAVEVAKAPVEAAFRELWPEAERVNLLDNSLFVDRGQQAELTPAMFDRFDRLGAYARGIGADGILFTCSAFGPAIERVARAMPVPVLKPNEAMFEAALDAGSTIGLVASSDRAVPVLVAELEDMARTRGRKVTIKTQTEPNAMPALQAGDVATHNRLLAEAAGRLEGCDVILLTQFSTSVAAPDVAARVKCQVLTSPGSAVEKMKRRLGT